METQQTSKGSMGRRAFIGVAVVGGIAVGFLAGWLTKPAEKAVETITSTTQIVSTTTASATTTAAVSETILPLRRIDTPQKGWHKVVDYERCTGCRICEFTCAEKYQPANFPGINLEYARIRVMRFPYVDIPMYCRYCKLEEWVEGTSKAPCEFVCPTGALQTVGADEVKEEGKVGRGYRWVDPAICSGLDNCGRCLEICEEQFGSGIFFAPPDEKGIKRAMVCTMCAGLPACVNACPERAIRFESPVVSSRYYAYKPRELAQLLFMKLYSVRRTVY